MCDCFIHLKSGSNNRRAYCISLASASYSWVDGSWSWVVRQANSNVVTRFQLTLTLPHQAGHMALFSNPPRQWSDHIVANSSGLYWIVEGDYPPISPFRRNTRAGKKACHPARRLSGLRASVPAQPSSFLGWPHVPGAMSTSRQGVHLQSAAV